MKIQTIGKPENMSRFEFKEMMQYYGRILLGKRLTKNIFIEVEFNKKFTFGGAVIPLDYDIRSRNHREFAMRFGDDLTYDQIIYCAAHEMAHVRQFARGELTGVDFRTMRWQGMKYIVNEKTYPLLPWEKDANRSEYWLMKFYRDYRETRKPEHGTYLRNRA